MAIKHLAPRTEKELKKVDKSFQCQECKKRGKIQHDIKRVWLWKPSEEKYFCKACRIKNRNKYIVVEFVENRYIENRYIENQYIENQYENINTK